MTTKTVRQALLDAADHIELVGLNQDGQYVNHEDYDAGKPFTECRKCTLGALGVGFGVKFTDGLSPRRNGIASKWQKARDAIAITAGIGSVTDWNDHHATQGEVVSTLRKAAELVTS